MDSEVKKPILEQIRELLGEFNGAVTERKNFYQGKYVNSNFDIEFSTKPESK